MKLTRFLTVTAIVMGLSGCVTYKYGDKTFNDRKEAESFGKADIDAMYAGIRPRNIPLAKNGRVVAPTKDLVINRGTVGPSADLRDYIATVYHYDYLRLAKAIHDRNIFERLSIEESSEGGHVVPGQGEAVIYLYMPDNKTAGWYYISKSTKRTPLHFDRGSPDKTGRVKYFIDSVEALAAGEPK